ncbi:MAG: hypothetical protein IPN17_11085 [Deltaproteobacteria bacterium]|nr:hypothetical protein [Deltaproteobacteria bacterium]
MSAPARAVVLTALALGCAPEETITEADASRLDARPSSDLAVDRPTDVLRLDASTDIVRVDAVVDAPADVLRDAAGDRPSGDAGPQRCTVTPSAEPFRSPALRLHWRATAGRPSRAPTRSARPPWWPTSCARPPTRSACPRSPS